MTIFRSRVADTIGYALLIIGVAGFTGCWIIGWNSEQRILGHTEFNRPTFQRPVAIKMKGRTFFVEADYARRYDFADEFILVFWLVAALGGGLKERDRILIWWKARKERR